MRELRILGGVHSVTRDINDTGQVVVRLAQDLNNDRLKKTHGIHKIIAQEDGARKSAAPNVGIIQRIAARDRAELAEDIHRTAETAPH